MERPHLERKPWQYLLYSFATSIRSLLFEQSHEETIPTASKNFKQRVTSCCNSQFNIEAFSCWFGDAKLFSFHAWDNCWRLNQRDPAEIAGEI